VFPRFLAKGILYSNRSESRERNPPSSPILNWVCSGGDKASPDRVSNQGRNVVHIQLLHNPGAVGFHGPYTQMQSFSNVLATLAFCDQLHNLPLPDRQRVQQFLRCCPVACQNRAHEAIAKIRLSLAIPVQAEQDSGVKANSIPG
jgi:hypothetical protein